MEYSKKHVKVGGGVALAIMGVAGGVVLGFKLAHWLKVKRIQRTQIPVTEQEAKTPFWKKCGDKDSSSSSSDDSDRGGSSDSGKSSD